MKKSDDSDFDDFTRMLMRFVLHSPNPDLRDGLSPVQVEILHLLANGIADCDDLGQTLGLSVANVRIQKIKLQNEISRRVVNKWLVQKAERKTETTRSVDYTNRGIDTAKFLPPKNAEFLLALMLGKENQEAALGCFAELYEKKAIRWGKSRARVWAWVQVAKTLAPVLKRLVLKLSGLAAAYEWVKHHLS